MFLYLDLTNLWIPLNFCKNEEANGNVYKDNMIIQYQQMKKDQLILICNLKYMGYITNIQQISLEPHILCMQRDCENQKQKKKRMATDSEKKQKINNLIDTMINKIQEVFEYIFINFIFQKFQNLFNLNLINLKFC